MTIFTKDFIKDPNALKDYQVDAGDWLGDDTLTDAVWTIPSGLTKVTDGHSSTIITVWLSGGTLGQDYDCYVDFTTTGGREDRAMIRIKVR
jgi:hypothetical protein